MGVHWYKYTAHTAGVSQHTCIRLFKGHDILDAGAGFGKSVKAGHAFTISHHFPLKDTKHHIGDMATLVEFLRNKQTATTIVKNISSESVST